MPSNDNPFSSYFNSNIFLLKLTSFWIYDQKSVPKFQQLGQLAYNLFWSAYLYAIYLPCEILYVVFFALNDFDRFVRSLRDIGNHCALIYKAFNYFAYRKQILDLVETLQNQPCNYEDYEDFRPQLIVKEHKKQAVKWTTYFLCFVNGICLTMFATGLYTFIFNGQEQFIMENGQEVYRQQPPVNIMSPFGNKTRLQFLVTFFFTIVALTFYAWMIVALDSLFITLMSCISAHLEILQGAFKTLRLRCTQRTQNLSKLGAIYNRELMQREEHKEMNACIRHLQVLFRVSEKMELIYSTQTLFQTLISLGEMCFSLYLMSQALDENTGNEITYLIATSFELLMYCWFGNRITETSMALSYALYESDWLPASQSFKKELIFTMTRMQKPIYVTIGKFTPLTFHTFLTIVRGAYSFFTFLKQRDRLGK